MKRYLLILSLASIATIHYAVVNANLGDIVNETVGTATDVVNDVVGGPVERTETVEVVRPVVVTSEPEEPAVVEEPITSQEPVVIHTVAPASAETVVYTEEAPHHRGWLRNVWYQITGY